MIQLMFFLVWMEFFNSFLKGRMCSFQRATGEEDCITVRDPSFDSLGSPFYCFH